MTNLNHAALLHRIERAYAVSGNDLGWRFLMSPAHVLDTAEVAFLGLNPGGNVRPPEHAEFAMSSGSAFFEESWAGHPPGKSPLQRQVQALFEGLGIDPEDVLAGNLVPFRSPDWPSLQNQKNALRFGVDLWRDVFGHVRPKLVIGMGREVTETLTTLLGANRGQRIPVGWGKVTGVRADFQGGTLVGLPHLSRFAIMRRPKSVPGVRALFDDWWRG